MCGDLVAPVISMRNYGSSMTKLPMALPDAIKDHIGDGSTRSRVKVHGAIEEHIALATFVD